MRSRSVGALICVACLAGVYVRTATAADPPARKLLGIDERNAVLSLIKAVDVAQDTDVTANDRVAWDGHVLRSGNQTGYLPFRLTLDLLERPKSAVVYVRAVTRHDGMRSRDERSTARDWLLRGNNLPQRIETVYVGTGELPVGGPASNSTRQSVSSANQALTVLALQHRELERQRTAADAAKKKSEPAQRDPARLPFEDYYVADVTSARGVDRPVLERALALPPGEYDVYVGLLDRNRLKTSSPVIVRQTVTVPDFWNDEIALSSLILASDIRVLGASPSAKQQVEHPYTFGRAEIIPVAAPAFSSDDALSVVYQVCNYGAPDADLQADYNFYRVDTPTRVLFNRTPSQHFGDEDLPPPAPWESVAFLTQTVSLKTFPPGKYELEVSVRDRLTRHSVSRSVSFTVAKP
jgi:hypothetical protein